MKIVKFGAIALALGLFAASCNNETATTETTTTDSTVTAPAPMETAPVVTDSAAVVAPAAGDSSVMKMETKTTTEEVKH